MAGLHPSRHLVNRMQKHKYNPMHIDLGVLSYELWLSLDSIIKLQLGSSHPPNRLVQIKHNFVGVVNNQLN